MYALRGKRGLDLGDLAYVRRANAGRVENMPFLCTAVRTIWTSPLNFCVCASFRPENVPRLFDLIRVQDEAIQPAFYFALRDTLVAKDLEQATRIAYGATRYRVVTLAGQLIDTSGG